MVAISRITNIQDETHALGVAKIVTLLLKNFKIANQIIVPIITAKNIILNLLSFFILFFNLYEYISTHISILYISTHSQYPNIYLQ